MTVIRSTFDKSFTAYIVLDDRHYISARDINRLTAMKKCTKQYAKHIKETLH